MTNLDAGWQASSAAELPTSLAPTKANAQGEPHGDEPAETFAFPLLFSMS